VNLRKDLQRKAGDFLSPEQENHDAGRSWVINNCAVNIGSGENLDKYCSNQRIICRQKHCGSRHQRCSTIAVNVSDRTPRCMP